MQLKKVFKLVPAVQHYAWGKPASTSLVAGFLPSVERDLPYAELWFGAHKKSPAQVLLDEGQLVGLDCLIEQFPFEILGRVGSLKYGAALSFLLKLLSIARPLSIQAHPSQDLAALLHKKDPDNYPDAREKLEFALALSEVELLHGFRKVSETAFFLKHRRAFAGLFKEETKRAFLETEELKPLYQELMLLSQDKLRANAALLKDDLTSLDDKREEDIWVLKLLEERAHDPGLYCFYLLNLFSLKPGQGIYTAACLPHAYLSGDLIECMTNSDNVVRGGLTDKYQDVQTLLAMLTYRSAEPEIRDAVSHFVSPGGEFSLARLDRGSSDLKLSSANILLSLDAEGEVRFAGRGRSEIVPRGAWLLPAGLGSCEVIVSAGRAFLASGE